MSSSRRHRAARSGLLAAIGLATSLLACPTIASAQSTVTRTVSYTYDAYNEVQQQTVQPGDSQHQVQTTFVYDQFGNQITATIVAQGVPTRTASAAYDSQGEFQTSTTNALGQTDAYAYDARFGKMTRHTDPNNVATAWAFDTFGRSDYQGNPDGTQISMWYNYCSGYNGSTYSSCSSGSTFQAESAKYDASWNLIGTYNTTEYDSLTRQVNAAISQFGGMPGFTSFWFYTYTTYDALGRVAQTSRPYSAFQSGSGSPKWTTYTYDILNRVTQTTFPDSSTKTYAYHGLTASATNADNETTTTVKNAQGLVADRIDAAGNTTSFVYDAFGNPLTVTDPNGNTITNTIDVMGRKTATIDPDMGSWSYTYDPLGELMIQTDAKSQTTTLTYDLLGRPIQRVEPDLTSNWVYDTAPYGIGKLASESTNAGFQRAFAYDSHGRPATTTITSGSTNYTYTTTYNSDNGQVASVSYPSGLTINYGYTSIGILSSLTDATSGTAYWTLNAVDAAGHPLTQTAGNGVVTSQNFDPKTGRLLGICATPDTGTCDGATSNYAYSWDPVGNLIERQDTYEGYTENFCYDALNRLTNYALGGSSCTSGTLGLIKTVGYDALGNITSKSDVGAYSYGSGAGPHAVTSISGIVNGVSSPTFTYDANGNMTVGDGRGFTYTAFNMAASVTEGSTNLCFTYDSEHQRIAQVQTALTCASPGGSPSTTTYLNDPATGAMSEQVASGATTTWRDYIATPGAGLIAERFNTAGTISILYFNSDHLGSTSILTAANGAVQERDSYDAWGKRRYPNGTDNPTCSITSATTHGYTGQEMMDSVCEINLNARIYDPTTARFAAADPTIPSAMSGQSYDRYSYVRNRPLSETDPTGYDDGLVQGVPAGWFDETTFFSTDDSTGGGSGGGGCFALSDGPIPTYTLCAARVPPVQLTEIPTPPPFSPPTIQPGTVPTPTKPKPNNSNNQCQLNPKIRNALQNAASLNNDRTTFLNLGGQAIGPLFGVNSSNVYYYDRQANQYGYVSETGTNGPFNQPGEPNGAGISVGWGAEVGTTNAPPSQFAGTSYSVNFGYGYGSYTFYVTPSGQIYAVSAGTSAPLPPADLIPDFKVGVAVMGSSGTLHTCH